ncbi:MAG TPA: DUF1080 domain-containing protein [Verrucomicrobiae bacterium]|nr:DUF1080 domain-containing protein [Verrucomicrobiae bacterium]
MGNPIASIRFLLCLCLSALTGCASHQAAVSVQSPPSVPSKQAPAQTNLIQKQDNEFKAAAASPPAAFEGEGWQPLFDGHSLAGWQETKFAGHGEVEVQDGLILMKMGDPFTGIGWTKDFPTMDYEIAMDAMRVSGSDFFCGLTVPVADSFCSLIVGGWGGALVGISSLDGMDASENETSKSETFLQNHWYRVRLRVTHDRIEGWIDRDKLIDVVTTGKKISLRPGEIEESKPMGIACWQTTAALRQIKYRHVDKPADPPKKMVY